MDRWVGRVAIVTGASAGIGVGIARLLVHKGMKVVGVARRENRIQDLANELKKEGAKGELFPVKADVTLDDDIKRVVKWTRDNLGGADVLVNNAGCLVFAKLSEISSEQIRKLFDLNVIGLTIFTREVIRDMRDRGVDDGHIFHINSVAGHSLCDHPLVEMYCASKHAVTVLTEGLRRELRDMKTKIRVTSISPGNVRSEIVVIAGLSEEIAEQLYVKGSCLEPEDIANALVYALGAPPHVQVHEMIIYPTGQP